MSSSITTEMDSLQVPTRKVYKIQPMDASHFAPHPDHYDDDEEVGLGYQRTLVNTSRYGFFILLILFTPFVLRSVNDSGLGSEFSLQLRFRCVSIKCLSRLPQIYSQNARKNA